MRAIAATSVAMRTRRSLTKERSEQIFITIAVAYSARDRNSFRRASAFVGRSEGEDVPSVLDLGRFRFVWSRG